jgi:hypothetical protein
VVPASGFVAVLSSPPHPAATTPAETNVVMNNALNEGTFMGRLLLIFFDPSGSSAASGRSDRWFSVV